MLETSAVIVIVVVAAAFVGRSLYRTAAGRKAAECSTCPYGDCCGGVLPEDAARRSPECPLAPPGAHRTGA